MLLYGTIVLGILVVGVAVHLARSWWKFRGARAITCPENLRPAGVRVDALHAAATGFGKSPELRLSSCSRWPEKAGCGQQCLSQIAASPEGCLVRKILEEWYEGEVCHCGHRFGKIDWADAKPGILTSDGISLEWDQVPADQLYEVLATSTPICFACHMANRLVHEHPDLAIDRGRRVLS